MVFRSQIGLKVWCFGRKSVSKYGVSVANYPDFTLKSENAELTVIEVTIIESLSLPLQQRFFGRQP